MQGSFEFDWRDFVRIAQGQHVTLLVQSNGCTLGPRVSQPKHDAAAVERQNRNKDRPQHRECAEKRSHIGVSYHRTRRRHSQLLSRARCNTDV